MCDRAFYDTLPAADGLEVEVEVAVGVAMAVWITCGCALEVAVTETETLRSGRVFYKGKRER